MVRSNGHFRWRRRAGKACGQLRTGRSPMGRVPATLGGARPHRSGACAHGGWSMRCVRALQPEALQGARVWPVRWPAAAQSPAQAAMLPDGRAGGVGSAAVGSQWLLTISSERACGAMLGAAAPVWPRHAPRFDGRVRTWRRGRRQRGRARSAVLGWAAAAPAAPRSVGRSAAAAKQRGSLCFGEATQRPEAEGLKNLYNSHHLHMGGPARAGRADGPRAAKSGTRGARVAACTCRTKSEPT